MLDWRPMKLNVIRSDIASVRADAICTSTNPRLSLYEGTGGAVRERGGWEIKRACEALLEEERDSTGRQELSVGAVRVTTPGSLPAKVVLHCVASDMLHRSSKEIISACVGNAIVRARQEGCASIAMPVFATGHAAFRFESAVEAMAEAIRDAPAGIEEITIALLDEERVEDVRRILEQVAGLAVRTGGGGAR